jgi:isopenicillin-N epimerase
MRDTRRDFLTTAGKAVAIVGAGMSALPRASAALPKGTDAAFWMAVKQAFMIDPQLHYHNIGGTGALPRHVVQNYDLYNRTIARTPDATYSIAQMRADVAPGFGANTDEIVLTTNTTDGMCMSLNGLDWAPGDEIISTNMEHPGGNGPMAHMAARKGVIIKRALLPVGADAQPAAYLNAFAAQLTSNTKAICFSHIPYLTGVALPAKALCAWARDHGLISIIDGAHVPGMLHVDFHDMGVDLIGSQMAMRPARHRHLVRAQSDAIQSDGTADGMGCSCVRNCEHHQPLQPGRIGAQYRRLPAVARALE